MNPGMRSTAQGNERTFRAVSYVLVFLLITCAVLTVSVLIYTVFPAWHTALLAGAALFVVLDRFYTYRYFKTLAPLSTEWAIALGTQWIVILLVIRLLLSYANGIDSLRSDLTLFMRGYLEELFTAEYVTGLLLAFLVWILSRLFLDLIDEIGVYQGAALHEEAIPIERDMVPAHQRMINLVFTLGIGLVVITAMTRMNLRTILSAPGKIPGLEFSSFSGAEAGALLYFVFGLGLLSLSRLMSLQTHWNQLRIPVSSKNLTRQWAVYSLLFLLLLALIVGLLPSGDSFGLFGIIGIVFGFLFQVILFLYQLIIGLILLLFSLPFLLMDKTPPVTPETATPPRLVLPTQPIMPFTNSEIFTLIRSVLLWGGLIAIVVFALFQFMKQHEQILPALRRMRVVNWLVLAWQWLYSNVVKTGGTIARVITDGWQSIASRLEGRQILSPAGLIGSRPLDRRHRIYFFYLAMIRRAGEQKMARKPSQTPAEYAVTLEKALPSDTHDIQAMTDAFVQARYTRQEVEPADVNRVKQAWSRIRRALQNKSKGESPSNK